MNILYDHQIFENQNIGGISRYFYELINPGFKTNHNLKLSLKKTHNLYIKQSDKYSYIFNNTENHYKNFILPFEFKGKHTIYSKYISFIDYQNINKNNSVRELKKGKTDIFHPTYYDNYFIDNIGKIPFVLTVYDMIHEKFVQYFADNTTELKKNLCKKATKIIAISESTKNDLVELFKIEESKIEVIYLANSLNTSGYIKVNLKLPDRYILFVGSRLAYKNFHRFYNSIIPILQSDKDLKVICTGSNFSEKEIELFKKSNIEDSFIHFYANDNELFELYKNALCFVFPSLYEGFGIPTLEAFMAKCPVILSNTSSMPEVGGDAAIYIDPYNENDIYEKINSIVNSKALRDEYITKGLEQLKKFNWEKCCKEHYTLYEKL